MPDVAVEKPITLDLLDTNAPALSATSDVPVIETKPDSAPAVEEPKAEEKAAAEEVKTEASESATEAEQPESTSASDEPKKPAKGVQKRLDELTRQREEEKRRADAADEDRRRLLELLAAKEKPAPTDEPVKPKREDFPDSVDYAEALVSHASELITWKSNKEFEARAEAERKMRDEASIAEQEAAIKRAYIDRVEKFRVAHSDYSEVAEAPDVKVSMPMVHAIIQSEKGPEIAYYLGSHRDEAARISTLPPVQQLMELGLITAKLSAPPSKPVSAAPAPIKPSKPGTTTADVPDDQLSMEQYAAKRKKQWAENARPGQRH